MVCLEEISGEGDGWMDGGKETSERVDRPKVSKRQTPKHNLLGHSDNAG
jgi:hypothetical protein